MKPFLKWAGGKRWLFSQDLVGTLPEFDRYIEPFVGGGAAFFAVKPANAILSDVNPELINLYRHVCTHPKDIADGLREFQKNHSKTFYYDQRAKNYTPDIDGAVRMLYLNRTCWNGLFRLNLSGAFNVPIGTKSKIFDPSEDFESYSSQLKAAELFCCDFESIIDLSKGGDLIFIDPPYTVKHNMNGFVKYNESIFEWKDQIRLSESLKRAINRGAKVIMTNADHSSIRELYRDVGEIYYQSRPSVISGSIKGRSPTTELVLVA